MGCFHLMRYFSICLSGWLLTDKLDILTMEAGSQKFLLYNSQHKDKQLRIYKNFQNFKIYFYFCFLETGSPIVQGSPTCCIVENGIELTIFLIFTPKFWDNGQQYHVWLFSMSFDKHVPCSNYPCQDRVYFYVCSLESAFPPCIS